MMARVMENKLEEGRGTKGDHGAISSRKSGANDAVGGNELERRDG